MREREKRRERYREEREADRQTDRELEAARESGERIEGVAVVPSRRTRGSRNILNAALMHSHPHPVRASQRIHLNVNMEHAMVCGSIVGPKHIRPCCPCFVSFIVCCLSSFALRPSSSSFDLRPPSFVFPFVSHSSCVILRVSSFAFHPSCFIVRLSILILRSIFVRSSFDLRPPSLTFRLSSFVFRRSFARRRPASRSCARHLERRPGAGDTLQFVRSRTSRVGACEEMPACPVGRAPLFRTPNPITP